MPYVNTYVEVDDVLDELSDDELIDELKRRGNGYNTQFVDGDAMRELLEKIWLNRRMGRDYQSELDRLIYGVLGKVI
jgi:hypothetical protein